jgi:DNA-binding CsgD family transcriptional regulator
MRLTPPGLELEAAASEFYSDLRLVPLLRRLLAHSGGLIDAAAGSVSLVNDPQHRYIKVAEVGASCQLGQSFSLDEGITGQVVARRRPVILDNYSDLRSGHLKPGHPAEKGSAIAIPIWWHGEVIGVNVLFAGAPRRFTGPEVDDLEILTQLAAAGIVRAGAGDPSLSQLIPSRPRARHEPPYLPVEVGRSLSAISGPEPEPAPFTPRERDVLHLLADGAGDKEIAQALVISTKTVEKHVGALLRKTGATSRTAAVMRALARGWLPCTVARA